jgi:CubicO group peptidase (beta-lactamase class C family)
MKAALLLAAVAAGVSSVSYEEFLHGNIFAPLQMKKTGVA